MKERISQEKTLFREIESETIDFLLYIDFLSLEDKENSSSKEYSIKVLYLWE